MILILFYYLVLPFLLAGLVLRFIKKYGKIPVPDEIARLFQEHPLEKRWFRVLARDTKHHLTALGDFEKQADAVDRAYEGRKQAQTAGEHAAFLVLNDKAEILEEVDA